LPFRFRIEIQMLKVGIEIAADKETAKRITDYLIRK